MIGNLEEEGIDNVQAKEEGLKRKNNEGRNVRASELFSDPSASTLNSSRQWSAFRNPRIVRVSRTFGGKDRHSKVCTIRGLRDRRIRLSVPTAVQLYDLQYKLGLGQPSKVIDWLIDASKEDIDNLPPLRMPQGFVHHHFNHQQMLLPGFHEPGLGFLKDGMLDHGSFLSRRHGININESHVGVDHHEGDSNSPHDRAGDSSLSYGTHLHLGSLRMTQELSEIAGRDSNKGKWVETHVGRSYRGAGDCSNSSQQAQVSAQNFFPMVSYSLSGVSPDNPMLPYGYNARGELSSPQVTNAVSVAAPHSSSSSSLLGLAPSQQMYFCQPAAMTPLFSPYPQQMGHHHLQMLSSLSSGFHLKSPTMKPCQENVSSKYYHQEDDDDCEDKDDDDEDGD